jgi:inner membrane protein
MPFSEKVCVLFDRKWRIVTGSRKELVLLVLFGMVAWSGGYIGSMGGMRALLGALTGSYAMAYQKYLDSDTHICYMEGKLRHQDGKTEKGSWLVIGKEGGDGVALWDEKGKRILHSQDAQFLSVRLKVSDEKWQSLAMNGWARTRKELFFYDGAKWKHGPPGAIVFGYIVARDLELETDDREKIEEAVKPEKDNSDGVALADTL